MAGECFAQVAGVLRPVGTVVRVDGEPLGGERGGYIILRGEGIAAGDVNLGAARVEHLGEVGGLGFEVDGHGDAHPAEGLGAFKFGADGVQNGHIGPHPVDLVSAARGGFGRGNVRVGHGISFMEKYGRLRTYIDKTGILRLFRRKPRAGSATIIHHFAAFVEGVDGFL